MTFGSELIEEPIPMKPVGSLDDIEKIIQSLIFKVGVNAVIAAATAAFPWLNLPIVSGIFRALVTWIASQLYNVLEPSVIFTVIDQQVSAEYLAYTAAVKELQKAIDLGDQHAIDAARAKTEDALSKLIHFDH